MISTIEVAGRWRRWRRGLAEAALLHSCILVALVVRIQDPAPAEPPSMAVELTAAPPAPAPKPVPPTPNPQPQHQQVSPLHDLDIPKTAAPGIVLPPPKPLKTEPAPATAPPSPPAPEQASAVLKAPQEKIATASAADPNVQATWQSTVLARLEAAKRYPAAARFAHEQATILARFTVDRQGKIVKAQLVRPSGVDDLDEEVMSLLRRVRLPAPPTSMADSDLTLTVPIEFSISQG